MRKYLLILLLLTFLTKSYGQTCCSGGVPVSSNLGFQSSEAGVLQLSVSADFNFLKTLKSGSETLDDDDRLRTTQSYIFRGAYTISERLTFEAFMPLIRQTRRITTLSGDFDKENTFGVGDPVALLIYDVIKSDFTLRIGVGPQFPVGSSSQRGSRGLLLLEDLQPGSGAWDLIVMTSVEYKPSFRPSGLIYLNNIVSHTGRNDDSRAGTQAYKFGNDIQIITGYSDQILAFNQIINPGISFRYRHANRDNVSQTDLPGTGGKFFFTRFSTSIPFPKVSSNLTINFEIPLWARVNETQLSPSYIFNIGWFKRFEKKPVFEDIINLN